MFARWLEAPPLPPAGFTYAECPPLVSLDDKQALVGRKVLTGHLEDGACGWFMGTVISSAVGKSWKKGAPTATHLVEYKEKETKTKKVVGKAATELVCACVQGRRPQPIATSCASSAGKKFRACGAMNQFLSKGSLSQPASF